MSTRLWKIRICSRRTATRLQGLRGGGNILRALEPTLGRARKALEHELSKVTVADIAAEVARLGKFSIPFTW